MWFRCSQHKAPVTVNDDGSITVVAPAHGRGVVDLRVVSRAGAGPVVDADQCSYVDVSAGARHAR